MHMTIRILVAEDEPGMAELLEYRLEKAGFDVALVNNGGDVQRVADTFRPDLVLLDIGLPIANGIEALVSLRSEPNTDTIPVVMLSGHDDDRDVTRALEAGANDYLVKPIAPELLLECIARHTTTTDSLPYNFATLYAWFGDDTMAIRKHVEQFLITLDADVVNLTKAASADESRQTAHHLTGATMNVGADSATAALRSIEYASDALGVRQNTVVALNELGRLRGQLLDWLGTAGEHTQ
jgi:DNA-binding response OmpR family regulator